MGRRVGKKDASGNTSVPDASVGGRRNWPADRVAISSNIRSLPPSYPHFRTGRPCGPGRPAHIFKPRVEPARPIARLQQGFQRPGPGEGDITAPPPPSQRRHGPHGSRRAAPASVLTRCWRSSDRHPPLDHTPLGLHPTRARHREPDRRGDGCDQAALPSVSRRCRRPGPRRAPCLSPRRVRSSQRA